MRSQYIGVLVLNDGMLAYCLRRMSSFLDCFSDLRLQLSLVGQVLHRSGYVHQLLDNDDQLSGGRLSQKGNDITMTML